MDSIRRFLTAKLSQTWRNVSVYMVYGSLYFKANATGLNKYPELFAVVPCINPTLRTRLRHVRVFKLSSVNLIKISPSWTRLKTVNKNTYKQPFGGVPGTGPATIVLLPSMYRPWTVLRATINCSHMKINNKHPCADALVLEPWFNKALVNVCDVVHHPLVLAN